MARTISFFLTTLCLAVSHLYAANIIDTEKLVVNSYYSITKGEDSITVCNELFDVASVTIQKNGLIDRDPCAKGGSATFPVYLTFNDSGYGFHTGAYIESSIIKVASSSTFDEKGFKMGLMGAGQIDCSKEAMIIIDANLDIKVSSADHIYRLHKSENCLGNKPTEIFTAKKREGKTIEAIKAEKKDVLEAYQEHKKMVDLLNQLEL